MKKFSKLFGLALLSASFLMPTLNSCKTGENDPGISLRSRDSRLSATWSLGSFDYSTSSTKESNTEYSDSDCGTEENETKVESTTITTSQFEKTADGSGDVNPDYEEYTAHGPVQFQDFSMEIAISKEGTYDAKMELKLTEENYYGGSGVDPPSTKVYTETYEKKGLEWSWVRDGERKAKVRFQDFPWPRIGVESSLDANNDYQTYVSSVQINPVEREFYIDKLKHKEMTMMRSTTSNTEDIEKEEYEGVDPSTGNEINCTKTVTETEEVEDELTIELTSEGDNITE